VCDSLRALFFSRRAESPDDEPAEGVVHAWAEWLKEEWIPANGGATPT